MSLSEEEIETYFENKNSRVCHDCKTIMIGRDSYGLGIPQCINPDCFQNNNPRHYCNCDHMQTVHEHILGVCLIEGCNCLGYRFLCTEKVWEAWH
ncbi:MAG TPA: hypothetical protein ENI23_05265 [bacterium]|nr:hypothetical protein [bacterium]